MKYQFEWDKIKRCADCLLLVGLVKRGTANWSCVYRKECIENILDKPDWCPLVEITDEHTEEKEYPSWYKEREVDNG